MSAPPAPPIVLASTSPQRRAILAQLGLPFEVVPPRYEELGDDPLEHAAGKARSVDGGDRPVLGVDTVVVLDGDVLGKPAGAGRGGVDAGAARGPDARGRARASACARRRGRSCTARPRA